MKMTFNTGPADLPRLIAVSENNTAGRARPDNLAGQWRVKLRGEVLKTADPHCTGVLSTLYAGDTWLASHLGVMSRSVFHHWFPVYNTEWAKCSPGHILTRS